MADPDRLDEVLAADPDDLEERYDRWASTYDADHDRWGWRGPAQVAEAVLRLGCEPRSGFDERVIVDAGCGTGRAGVALREAGWTGRLVGLDLSQGMLGIAAGTDTYDGLIQCSLYQIPLGADTVEAVVSSGVFTHGHVGGEALEELARITGPGVCSSFGQDVAVQVAVSGRRAPAGGGFGVVKS